MPSTEVQTAQTMMICKYDIIIRQQRQWWFVNMSSSSDNTVSPRLNALPPSRSWNSPESPCCCHLCCHLLMVFATDLDDGEHADVDGHVAHLVLLASTEEQVGDDEEVLVQLVNLVGHCSVKVVFLQQNDDENDTMHSYDWNTAHIDFNVSTWSFSASWVTVRFFPSHPLARQLTCLLVK